MAPCFIRSDLFHIRAKLIRPASLQMSNCQHRVARYPEEHCPTSGELQPCSQHCQISVKLNCKLDASHPCPQMPRTQHGDGPHSRLSTSEVCISHLAAVCALSSTQALTSLLAVACPHCLIQCLTSTLEAALTRGGISQVLYLCVPYASLLGRWTQAGGRTGASVTLGAV